MSLNMGNVLLAKFMGYKKIDATKVLTDDKSELWLMNEAGEILQGLPKYNLDYNLLMQVWNKFKNLEMKGIATKRYHEQVCQSFGNSILNGCIEEAHYNAVIAVKWYNEVFDL